MSVSLQLNNYIIRSTLAALALLMSTITHAEWENFQNPSQDPPTVHGGYSNGCIQGAQSLNLNHPGYIVMRPSRNRYYGHPKLINFVNDMGSFAQGIGQRLLVGDLSQPRGGPMSFGHSSHETGLDVDFWLQTIPLNQALSMDEREWREFQTVVDKSAGRMLMDVWRLRYTAMIKRAATHEEVERIFVNPIIKKHLCQSVGAQSWMYKIRPWWGHDAHIHVRLRCPAGSTTCEPQNPPPQNAGCNADLDNWIYDQANPSPSDPSSKPKSEPPPLPQACQRMLNS